MTQYPEAWLCRELGMAVVNISLITDYDAGVLEGTEAVNAHDVLEVFAAERRADPEGRARPDRAVPGGPGRPRCAGRPGPHPGRRSRDVAARTSDCSRRDSDDRGRMRLPIGVCIRAIRAEPAWWLESARRLDAAGYAGVWCWDHFMGRGDTTVPVVEGWTILAMAAAQTSRVTVGPFVLNVMNRHPALVARMASTLQIASGGRLVLGIGHRRCTGRARGVRDALPGGAGAGRDGSRRRWPSSGRCGPVARSRAQSPFYPLTRPSPTRSRFRHRRIVIGGETPAGARLAGRIGDGWSTFDGNFERRSPALPRVARRGRQAARGPAGAGRVPGRLARGRSVPRDALVRGSARDMGSLGGGRRRWRDRAGPHDGRRRCAGGGGRALVIRPPSQREPAGADRRSRRGSRTRTPGSWHHPRRDLAHSSRVRHRTRPHIRSVPGLWRTLGTDPWLRPLRRAGRHGRGPVRSLQPARAPRRGGLPGPWHGHRRGHRRGRAAGRRGAPGDLRDRPVPGDRRRGRPGPPPAST